MIHLIWDKEKIESDIYIMSDLISVIIPIYNSEKYIRKCVDSILQQTYKNIEVILVDDGSSDMSASICDEYKRNNDNVTVLHKQNEGLVKARKDGFRLSSGKWIAFVDSDDWIKEDMMSSLYSMAKTNDADVVISGVNDVYGPNTNSRCNNIASGIYKGEKLQSIKKTLFCGEEYFSFDILPYLWNKLWARNIIEESIIMADDKINVGEDVSIGFPAILQSKCIAVTNETFYYYRQNNESMLNTEKKQLKEYDNSKRLFHFLNNRLANMGFDGLYDESLKKYYIHLLFTRSYEIVNLKLGCKGLFPYLDGVDKPIIIYGAGALGSAIYEYASKIFNVNAWVDSNAETLKNKGYPVMNPRNVSFGKEDVVLIAVFIKSVAENIYDFLIENGARKENIVFFKLSNNQENELLSL